jgi:hypothetical protein
MVPVMLAGLGQGRVDKTELRFDAGLDRELARKTVVPFAKTVGRRRACGWEGVLPRSIREKEMPLQQSRCEATHIDISGHTEDDARNPVRKCSWRTRTF